MRPPVADRVATGGLFLPSVLDAQVSRCSAHGAGPMTLAIAWPHDPGDPGPDHPRPWPHDPGDPGPDHPRPWPHDPGDSLAPSPWRKRRSLAPCAWRPTFSVDGGF